MISYIINLRLRILIPIIFIIVIFLLTIFAPFVATSSPFAMDSAYRLSSESNLKYPLGNDMYGRCVYSRIVYGGRLTLGISFSGALLATIIGSVIGMVSGFFKGYIAVIFMRIIDALMSIPVIILAIFVVAFLGAGIQNIIFVIAIIYSPRIGRVAYSATLSVVENEYIESAQAAGASNLRIIIKYILPNIFSSILVMGTLTLAHAVILEASLSFLGLGTSPGAPSWGRLVMHGMDYINLSSHLLIYPATVLSLTVLAFNFLGDALRDYLDPKISDY